MVSSVPAPPGPPAERIPAAALPQAPPCDADAGGSETAQVQLVKGKAVLSLCGHHFRAHELDLAAAGWVITRDSRVDGW